MSARGSLPRAKGAIREAGRRQTQALHRAIHALAQSRPLYSARIVATPAQKVLLIVFVAAVIGLAVAVPQFALRAVVAAMAGGFVVSLLLRTALAAFGRIQNAPAPPHPLPVSWPLYTILVPLYREAAMLPQIAAALDGLDYPPDRLDIKLVVERDDAETRAAAQAWSRFETIVVPRAGPRTKPKACNYALQFSRGRYVVVYDAEDRPAPDQLRKAVTAFAADPAIGCFQARLTIDRGTTWLARLFALDYRVWFHTLLPGLERCRAPIPLGGTSNHFRREVLAMAGAWDPYNVTEDADLGFRLARLGYRVAMLDSDTFEEAPERFDVWLRQRTRWMKGYMQTLLVHTRAPRAVLRQLGVKASLMMPLFLGGAVWSALVNPLLWIVFLFGLNGDTDALVWLARISGGTLLVANALLAALSLTGAPGRFRALGIAPFYPLYWLLISIAAWRALFQLIGDPHRWEKTPHGAAAQ